MCALLIAIALPHVVTAKKGTRSNTELSKSNIPPVSQRDFLNLVALAQEYHYSESLDRETRNELLNQIRTTYTPPQDVPLKQSFPNTNRKRSRREMTIQRDKVTQSWANSFENRKRVVRRKVETANLEKIATSLNSDMLWKHKLNASEVRRIQGTFRKDFKTSTPFIFF